MRKEFANRELSFSVPVERSMRTAGHQSIFVRAAWCAAHAPALARSSAGGLLGVALLAAALGSFERVARADEPVKTGEPRMLSEPGELTDVVDAFDGDDLFDLHLSLGYQYGSKTAHVRRETSIGDAQNAGLTTGGFTASNMNVAAYEEATSRLNTRADIGIFRDVAVYARLPIVLSNERRLQDLDGSASVIGVVASGGPLDGAPLFTLPFKSPQRSGIEYLAVGLDVAVMNQYRDRTKPTWLAGVEARFGVSEPMHACNGDVPAGQVRCAHPADATREGTAQGARAPGVSRGTNAVELHTFISRRSKYIEPYSGFRALFEFPQSASDFGSTDLKGVVANHPPLQGWAYAGMMVIPWEQREQFQRVTFDGRIGGSYRSEGRDYSELFDALGSSAAPSLRSPAYGTYHAGNGNDSVVDPTSPRVFFTGITNVSAYAAVEASLSVTWQAGEYIKFQVGGRYTREQGHLITSDQPCNPAFTSDIAASGPCRAVRAGSAAPTGVPNPNYRPTIDSVGRRFKVDDVNLWDAWLNGTVMF